MHSKLINPHKLSCLPVTIDTVCIYLQLSHFLLDCCTPEPGTDAFSQHITMNYQPTSSNIPEGSGPLLLDHSVFYIFLNLTFSP